MPYHLSSGRRYLNGELVDPPQLGPWRESDLFPELLWDDLVAAGLNELEFESGDDWAQMDEWLLSLETSEIPLAFLIERCCDNGWLLGQDLIATRLKEFPLHWQQACVKRIADAPEFAGEALISVVAKAVSMVRARPQETPVVPEEKRRTLTFFRPG